MTDSLLAAFERKLDRVIGELERLSQQNVSLEQQLADAKASTKAKEEQWQLERKRLIDKNELAKTRVEAMIGRLKSLEEHS